MPLSDEQYQELLQSLRLSVREEGLGAVDERIVSQIREDQKGRIMTS